MRGIVFARLANFVEGNAKTRPVIAERIASLLDGPLPVLPLGGHVAAGEILTLAPLMNAIERDFEEGETMAVVNGSPCAAALAADVALAARHRCRRPKAPSRSPSRRFAPRSTPTTRRWRICGRTARGRRAARAPRLAGGRGNRSPRPPGSRQLRILPRVLGQAHRAVGAIEYAATVSLRSVTDNPVYRAAGRATPARPGDLDGGYHNGMVYPAMERAGGSLG